MIEARLRELRPGLADATLKTYARAVSRMQKLSQNLDMATIRSALENMDVVQARNILTALVVFDGPRWRRLHEKFMSAAEGRLRDQRLTDREAANRADWATIKKVVRRLRRDVDTHKLFDGGLTSPSTRGWPRWSSG